MNYAKARQRETDKRWDYTNMNDNRIYPIGYCGRNLFAEPYDPKKEVLPKSWYEAEQAKCEPFKHKYHEDGHATEAEAEECYRQYQLDRHLRYGSYSDTQKKCLTCGDWTDGFAEIRYRVWPLCEKHRNRDEVEKLFTVGEEWYT